MNPNHFLFSTLVLHCALPQAWSIDDPLLDALTRNGFITQEQARSILAETDESRPVYVEAKRDTTATMRFKARFQWQAGYASVDSDYKDLATEDYSTFETRRMRFGVEGEVLGPWKYNLIVNLGSATSDFHDVDVTYTGFDNVDLAVGFTDFFTGIEESISDSEIITVERSQLSETFDFERTAGAWADGNLGPLLLYGAVINGEDNNTNPLEDDGSSKLGLNFQSFLDLGKLNRVVDGTLGFQTTQYFDSDNIAYSEVYSVNANLTYGKFGFIGDILWGTESDRSDQTRGFMVMPYYNVTEAIQAVLRYDTVESDRANALRAPLRYAGRSSILGTEAADGDEYQALYLGVNYYIYGNNLKMMGGIEFSELKDTIETNATAARATTVYGAVRGRF